MQEDFKSFCDKVFSGETLIVSRPKNENVVMISEKEYNELTKARRNAEYLAMLAKSDEDLREGRGVIKMMDELEAMES